MADKISGVVTNVIDGDTFDINVNWQSPYNKIRYNQSERIRINNTNAPELNEPGGPRDKDKLKRRIEGKQVNLTIYSRDTYSRLICDVSLA